MPMYDFPVDVISGIKVCVGIVLLLPDNQGFKELVPPGVVVAAVLLQEVFCHVLGFVVRFFRNRSSILYSSFSSLPLRVWVGIRMSVDSTLHLR